MTRPVHDPSRLGLAAALCLGLGLAACSSDSAPPLAMAETNTVGTEDLPLQDDEPEDATAQPNARELWFVDGPGHEAILARERRDHDRAVELLDGLLADETLASGDRAAAQLLRALEDTRLGAHARAADGLAQARRDPALTPVEPYLRMLEAQARLDAQDAPAALALVDELEPDLATGVPTRVLLVKADAQARTNDRPGAITTYRAFLAEAAAEGSAKHEARLKLAEVLVEGEPAAQREAAELFEKLVEEVPLSSFGERAEDALTELERAKVITRTKAERRTIDRRKALALAERELERRDYGDAIKTVDRTLAKAKALGLDEGDRCQSLYTKGSAIFKQRKRPAAQPVFDLAAKHCAKAGNATLEVKSRYQAARGVYAAGKYNEAAARFEDLARDHAGHSYADDAWVKAGESWESATEPAKARSAYESSLAKHPDGDMYGEALRRLLVQAFAEDRISDALALIDSSITSAPVHGDELAKLHYFRGKALAKLGRDDEAEAAWLRTVETRPLSYPALLAVSRLRERGEDAATAALELMAASPSSAPPGLALPATPSARRVKIWASLGLGDQAREELDAAKITGWPAVAVLAQAGLYSEAQVTLANIGSGWREGAPNGAWRDLWELAHPAPFRGLVDPGERDHGVPTLLTYAIMQTESRFNPGATSWAGARGLIQLMPATAEHVAQKAGLDLKPSELYDPAVNLDIGQRYLAGLTARWGNVDGATALAVPSYNAGPGRTDDWLDARGSWDLDLFVEAIPFDETRHYTQSVLGRWAAYRWLYGEGEARDRLPYIPLKIPPRAAG